MADVRAAALDAVFGKTIAAHERARRLDPAPVLAAADAILDAVRRDGAVLVCGNGGSAADAQHFAAELVGRYARERRALRAVALSTDTSILTALGNDYGFERVFARQVEAHGRPGDVLIGISTSGASANVIAAIVSARQRGLRTIGLTGRDGGELGRLADIHVNVPEQETARTQEVHITLLHALCELIERELE